MGKPVLIGAFLHRIKRPVEIEPDKNYKLVTVKLNHKGVVLRQEKLGAEIKTKMFEVKTGDFILSGIDARNGAFGIVPPELDGAIVTNDFWYFDLDEEISKCWFFQIQSRCIQFYSEHFHEGIDNKFMQGNFHFKFIYGF